MGAAIIIKIMTLYAIAKKILTICTRIAKAKNSAKKIKFILISALYAVIGTRIALEELLSIALHFERS